MSLGTEEKDKADGDGSEESYYDEESDQSESKPEDVEEIIN